MPKDAEDTEKRKIILLRNIIYAHACVRNSLSQGEFPYASHLFFTPPGILDDNVPEERERGIRAGKELISQVATLTAVYIDLGVSSGMKFGIEEAQKFGRKIDYRKLEKNWMEKQIELEFNHSQMEVYGNYSLLLDKLRTLKT
jgi:hypothetical protein